MNKTLLKTKDSIKSHKWISAIIGAVILVILLFVIFKKSANTATAIVTVEKRTITEVVSATGNVKPLSNVDLSFEKGGRASYVSVSVGDKVYAGEFLASVSNLDLIASVDQAGAGLKIAQANLDALKNGSTPEQIAVSQSQVQKAEGDLAQAKQGLINSIQDSYAKADDSIRNKIDVMFTNPRSQNAQLNFQTTYSQYKNDLEQGRVEMEDMLVSWNNSIIGLNNSSDIDHAENSASANLETIKNFLNKLALVINNLIPNGTVTQTIIDGWKVTVSTTRANIGLAISGLSTNTSGYRVAVSALSIAKNNLAVTKSGATAEQIAGAEASVEQAQANVDNTNAQLSKSIIRSPINGVITTVNTKVGEVIQASAPAISVISYGEYDVEAFVPEADIAKIKVGDIATTTLDAYGSNTYFQTSVIKIDPAETVIEGVPTYKVTLKFSQEDERVKSGMTANLDILTNQKVGVLSLPSRSVYSTGDKKFVKNVDFTNKTTEKEVQTGIRGVDGFIEIISGLNEGDKVVVSPNI